MEEQQNKVNAGKDLMHRLHGILCELDRVTVQREMCTKGNDVISAIKTNLSWVVCLYKELSQEMSEELSKQHSDVEAEIRKRYTSVRVKFARGCSTEYTHIFKTLDQWELTLRRFAQKKDLILKKELDARLN